MINFIIFLKITGEDGREEPTGDNSERGGDEGEELKYFFDNFLFIFLFLR